jgi:peptide/nickel transport system substrate-binding protein
VATAECVRFRGKNLVVGIVGSDPGHLNPAISSNGGLHTTAEPLYNGLIGLDANSNPYPDLAESWVISDVGKRYEFKLRPGVKWHDGRDLTAGDVKFTFEHALRGHSRTQGSMGLPAGSAGSPLLYIEATRRDIDGDRQPDEVVVFQFNRPYAPLLQQLNVTEAPIIPAHRYPANDPLTNTAANRDPKGTGPFMLRSYGNDIQFVRNPNYYRRDLPCLDGMVERFFPDNQTASLALEGRELDWSWEVDKSRLAPLRGNGALRLAGVPRGPGGGNCLMTVGFNLLAVGDRRGQRQTNGSVNPGAPAPHPHFGDVRVRKAVAHALNRQAYLDQIEFGQGRVAAAPVHSGIGFAHAPQPIPGFSLAEANRLLDEAGRQRGSDGTRFSVDFWGIGPGTQVTYGNLLKAQLAEVGINVTVRSGPQATFGTSVFVERNFDLAVVSYCNGDDPQIGVRRQYHSTQYQAVPFTNLAAYRTPGMDGLWDQAGAQVDPNVSRNTYRQIQEAAAGDQPYLWLVETEFIRAHRSACSGFNYGNTGLFAETAFCR